MLITKVLLRTAEKLLFLDALCALWRENGYCAYVLVSFVGSELQSIAFLERSRVFTSKRSCMQVCTRSQVGNSRVHLTFGLSE